MKEHKVRQGIISSKEKIEALNQSTIIPNHL
jgi:hypothetical protein